jgi:hypothetical protein
MALQKETLTVATSELLFLGSLPSEDAKSMIYYFQGSDYIPDYNLEISPDQAIENIGFQGDIDLISGAFKPSHKFTIIKESLGKYPNLKSLQVNKIYSIRYAISPQNTGGDRAFSYAKMKFIKVNGVINPVQNGTTSTTTSPATATAK